MGVGMLPELHNDWFKATQNQMDDIWKLCGKAGRANVNKVTPAEKIDTYLVDYYDAGTRVQRIFVMEGAAP